MQHEVNRQKVSAVIQEASERANAFMERLFRGDRLAQCVCETAVKYKNGRLQCDGCGRVLNRVEYVHEYTDDIYVQTTVDVEKGKFLLRLNNTDDFSNGDNTDEDHGNIIIP